MVRLHMSRSGIKTGGFLVFMIFPALVVFAQAPVSSIPESLLLEVVKAPGYSFMDGCADPGMMRGQAMAGAEAAAPDAAEAADHAAHHPDKAVAEPSPELPDESSRKKMLEDLERAARLFGSFQKGDQDSNVKN